MAFLLVSIMLPFCTRFLKLLDVREHAVTGILLYSGLV